MSSPSVKHTLEIDSVNLSFGEREILSGVYLRMETGKVTALLGSNGSGKSCLMRILFGELKPQFKSIRLDGKWFDALTSDHVLYLTQYCSIPENITVLKAFDDFGLDFKDFLAYFPLLAYCRSYRIGELSGGVKRVIETWLILMSESDFVMLDEPFSHVTPTDVEIFKTLILEQKDRKGILITDHLWRNVVDISDEMYVLSDRTVYVARSEEDLVRRGYIRAGEKTSR